MRFSLGSKTKTKILKKLKSNPNKLEIGLKEMNLKMTSVLKNIIFFIIMFFYKARINQFKLIKIKLPTPH